jgi:hypothetical protein
VQNTDFFESKLSKLDVEGDNGELFFDKITLCLWALCDDRCVLPNFAAVFRILVEVLVEFDIEAVVHENYKDLTR